MLLKITNYFLIYRWRKLALIFCALFSLVGIILTILWINSFLLYIESEIDFTNNNLSKAAEQKTLFLSLNIFNLVFFSITIIGSIIFLLLIQKGFSNAYIFLKIITYLSFLIIAILILLISIKPQTVTKTFTHSNGFVSEIVLSLPNYGLGWVSLFLVIAISLFTVFSRSNYGFLKK